MWEETLFQRPQQLMKRFQMMGHPTAYLSMIGTRRWLRLRFSASPAAPLRGVTAEGLRFVTLPFVPFTRRLRLARLLSDALWQAAVNRARRRLPPGPDVLWLYHPDLADFARRVPHDLLVYDVMDQFDAFDMSLKGVASREEELLRLADVVFTGGRTMHERKAAIRPDARCFPSGVDAEHFGSALKPETPVAAEIAHLPRPVLGFIGAVDERIDYPLVEAVCRARPAWSYVFIGPLVAMARAPVDAPNFHCLGARPYARLPEYLKGFDVATMPWVQSELTAHISPTKTPEYLAAGRPVVTTPTPDIERDYGGVVSLARGAEAFIAACEACIRNPPANLAQTLAGRAAAASWETIAQRMRAAILEKLAARAPGAV